MLRLSHCVLLRAIGLASATAIIAGASTAGAFDDALVDETAVLASTSEQASTPSEARSNPAAYAQLFGPFEQLFRSSDWNRRQSSKPPRAHTGRDQTAPRYTTIPSLHPF